MRAALGAVLLLLAAGVGWAQDPNVKAPDGYTPLARLLFSQREPFKLDQIRALLDKGADPNLDHGGWGRWGALGLARRDEPQVVELLVSRGATLADESRRGPLVIAIEMERDDLALALLRRDKQVPPQDRLTLPLAARRGWTELVSALIAAGADVNAVDANGHSAIAFAQRRRDAAMAKALQAAGARPTNAVPRPRFPAGTDFADGVAPEVDDVLFFDPPRFTLTTGRDATSFAFYGEEMNRFAEVKCERSASFGFIAMANIAGGIRVGICAREAKRVRQLAVAAPKSLDALVGMLSRGAPKPLDRAMLEKAGLVHSVATSPTGAEEHYFALLAVGHGILSAPTLVVLPKGGKRAIIVQSEPGNLCEAFGIGPQIPLCTGTRQALADIARRIEARFPN